MWCVWCVCEGCLAVLVRAHPRAHARGESLRAHPRAHARGESPRARSRQVTWTARASDFIVFFTLGGTVPSPCKRRGHAPRT